MLSACNGVTEQWAQNQVEATYAETRTRLAAQGNPQFSDPVKAQIVNQFERDFARFGRDVSKLTADAAPSTCAIADKQRAFLLVRGETVKAAQDSYSHVDMTYAPDLDSIEIQMVSGECSDLNGSGPVEYVASMRAASRVGSAEGEWTFIQLGDSTFRVSGEMVDGRRSGPFRTIEIKKSTRMDRGQSGEFEVTRSDWEHLNRMSEALMAVYTYETFGDSAPGEPTITFMRQPERNFFATYVEETRPGGLVEGVSYNGAELRTRYSMRDGVMHGPFEIVSYTENGVTIPRSTICYQNGEEVRAARCPTD